MAKSDQRRKKAAEKKRQKSKVRARTRATRVAVAQQDQRSTGSGDVLGWPVGECYLGSSWHEQGARVHAVFSRRHSGGRVAAAFFDVDLAELGVVEARRLRAGPEGAFQNELSRHSTEEEPLLLVQPDLVVKLVREAFAFADDRGLEQASKFAAAQEIFGDVEPDGRTPDIGVGPKPPPKEKKPGLLSSLFGRK